MKTTILLVASCAIFAGPALAEDSYAFPAPIPHYPFGRSYRTCKRVAVPPYRQPFTVRVYTTPQQQPYYNTPPYPVIAPY